MSVPGVTTNICHLEHYLMRLEIFQLFFKFKFKYMIISISLFALFVRAERKFGILKTSAFKCNEQI